VTRADVLAAVASSLVVLIAALALAVARLSNRITRLEEWVRLYERRRNGE
jgi:hypothetical protein